MYKIEIIESQTAFEALKDAWQALAERVPTYRFSQSYIWCYAGWRHFSPDEKAQLKCLTVWQQGELVGVWAFKRVQKGVAAYIQPLGMGFGDEYAEPLLAPGVDSLDLARRMFRELARHGDALNIHFLPAGSNLAKAVAEIGRPRLHYLTDSYVIDPSGSASWEGFMERYSTKMRAEMRRKFRGLQALGPVTFSVAQTPQEAIEMVNWVVAQKRSWFEARGTELSWFYKAASKAFMDDMAFQATPDAGLCMSALKVGERIVAASICTIDSSRIEGLIVTFDQEYARFSPGMQFIEELAHFAYRRGLELDMRILAQGYKTRWANLVRQHETWVIACNAVGAAAILPVMCADWGQQVLRDSLSTEKFNQVKTLAKTLKRRLRNAAPKAFEGRGKALEPQA